MTEAPHDNEVDIEAACTPGGELRDLTHHVLGRTVDTRQEMTAVVDALSAIGFLDSEILVLCGQATADVIGATTGRRGLAHAAMGIARARRPFHPPPPPILYRGAVLGAAVIASEELPPAN